jgi:hypothetical protein
MVVTFASASVKDVAPDPGGLAVIEVHWHLGAGAFMLTFAEPGSHGSIAAASG